jgi:hypothetical protein
VNTARGIALASWLSSCRSSGKLNCQPGRLTNWRYHLTRCALKNCGRQSTMMSRLRRRRTSFGTFWESRRIATSTLLTRSQTDCVFAD